MTAAALLLSEPSLENTAPKPRRAFAAPLGRAASACGVRCRRRFFTGALLASTVVWAAPANSKKITYEDDVLPIFRDNCLKCHNPDKLKGDLDLTSFSSAVKGGGSGVTLNSSDPDGSQLYKSITHAEEPTMPPNAKLKDRDIATIRQWIEGGLLQGSGSKALAANKPAVDLSLKSVSIGRPAGPPPMPVGLAVEPYARAHHGTALTSIVSNPWAPVIALASARQIVFYDSTELEFLGVLPFTEGLPCDLKFSRNGRLLLAGGGRGGKSGAVVVWDTTTGERIITIGDQFDSVLAADISANQQWIALGGPDRVLKIYRTADGTLEHRIKKHTEWITAVEFSPDGKYLASGDRNGGLVLWEAATGLELFSLPGHKGAITALTWRSDSAMVLSASEDGTLKLWKSSDGSALRSITAHAGGALSANFTADGRIASCGRDNKVQIWDTSGKNLRTLPFSGDLPNRVTFNDDGKRIIASDWQGRIRVWDALTGQAIGELEANPPPLGERVQQETQRLKKLQAEVIQLAAKRTQRELDASIAHVTLEQKKKAREEIKKQIAAQPKAPTAPLAASAAGLTTPPAPTVADGVLLQTLRAQLTALEKALAHDSELAATAAKQAAETQTSAEAAAAKLAAAKLSLAKWEAALRATKGSDSRRQASAR
ncbi:MAG: Chromosome partition protein Smc [Verrucomicrobiota bacterium]